MLGDAARSPRPASALSVAALALTLATLTGCGGSSSSQENSPPVSNLHFEVFTSEWDATRHLLVVGDSGSATVSTETRTCLFGGTCPVSVDIEIRSSNPAVVAPDRQRVRTPANVVLIAHAPGTAQVTAAVAGLSASERVDVTATPLPVDSLRVRSARSAFDSLIAVEDDAAGQLAQLTLPLMGYAALETTIFRNQAVVHMPFTLSSSNSAVAWVGHCRPAVIDPQCSVFSEGGWVTGLAVGEATVTITARNLQRSFAVTVK